MNKKVLLFFVTAILSVMGVKADVIPSSYRSEAGAGSFYIQNTATGKFFNSNSRNVQDAPYSVTVTAATGGYLISGYGDGKYLKLGDAVDWLWNDDTSGTKIWKFNIVDADTKTYTISSDDVEGSMATGDWYVKGNGNGATQTVGDAGIWILVTPSDYEAYQASLGPAVINKTTIIEAKGDATSLVTNPNFENEVGTEWTGGIRTSCNTWRDGTNYVYRATANATFSQTIADMPAGTYKVVAAIRGVSGSTVSASVAESAGEVVANTGYEGEYQINKNGVLMPKPAVTNEGFNTAENALGWKWATATGTLAADGNLTIAFTVTGSDFMEIDDVHLYYMSDGENNYAVEYSDGINNNDHVVTCDLQTDNPNKIFRASSNIYTASGAITNNLRINSNGWINKLVLYDGYDLTIPASSRSVNSTLYRNIAAGTFATICCPFEITGGADGTFYQPESLTAGILNFETVTTKHGGRAYLYKAESAVTELTHAGDHWLAENITPNGSGVQMVGTYTNIAAITYDDYVLNGTNLYKVNSIVTLKPFRAYFTIPGGNSNARITLNFDDETTGINVLETESTNDNASLKDGKYFQNGKIVIVKNGVKYATNGQIVK